MPKNEQIRPLLLNLHRTRKERKKVHHKRRCQQLTTDDSKASDKCESPPIVPANTDTQMVDDIASDSDSTSSTNDSEASDKCESPLIDPGTADTQRLDKATAEFEKLLDRVLLKERWRIDK